MDTDLTNILNHLRRFISESSFTYATLADKLQVNEKTILNWIHHPDGHPIPLCQYLQMCDLLGKSPHSFFPDLPVVFPYLRITDPISVEKEIFAIEESLPPGGVKKVFVPLWNLPIWHYSLISFAFDHERYYYAKNLTDQRRNLALDICEQRRKNFEEGRYRINLIICKKNFEDWIALKNSYTSVNRDDIDTQLKHLCLLLKPQTLPSRLELRMVDFTPQLQFAVYEQIGKYDIVMMSTNTGIIQIQDKNIDKFFDHEFSLLWTDRAYDKPSRNEDWIKMFNKIIDNNRIGDKMFKITLDGELL